MTQIAEFIAVSPAGIVPLARLPLPAPSGLGMRSLDRSLAEIRHWAAGTLAEAGRADGSGVWLVLNEAGAETPAALTDGLDRETCAARLAGIGGTAVVSTSGELADVFASGFAPLPILAVTLAALEGVAPVDAPSGEPDATALASALLAGGAGLRLSPAPQDFAVAPEAVLRSALAIRRTLGHVPAECLRTIAAATGKATPSGLRRIHARLNGDAAARRSIASSQAEASFAAIGCANLRPVRHNHDAAGAGGGDRSITTELGRWTLDAQWADSQIRRSRRVLSALKGLRASEDCVIVGNGPSLKTADPELFRQNDVIVSNFAALSPLLSETANILTVVNGLVAEQGAAAFNLSRIPVKLAPLWLAENLHEDAGFCFVDAVGEPAFLADDPAARVSWAGTVSFFNMQIAYHLGYRRVLLVGFDHSYAQPDSAAEGAVLEQAGDDPNHFDPLYFAGKKWQKANLDLMQQVYILARTAFEADGREILNLSPESALTIFPMASVPGAAAPADGQRAAPEAAPAPVRRSYALPPAPKGLADGQQLGDGPAGLQRAGKRWAEPSIAGVELTDKANAPGYRHLNFGFRDVRAGERAWTYFFLKLQLMEGRHFLEIRRNDIMPVGLATWPETDTRDDWGDYLRVAVGVGEPAESARLRGFLDGLTDGDRYAVSFLLGEAAGHMRQAIAALDGDAPFWNTHVSAMSRMINDTMGLPRSATA